MKFEFELAWYGIQYIQSYYPLNVIGLFFVCPYKGATDQRRPFARA